MHPAILRLKTSLKWIIPVGIFFVLVAVFFSLRKETPVLTQTVAPADFIQQISVSGRVTPTDLLNLTFEQSGRITSIPVHVGDRVRVNQLLATQDTRDLQVQLLNAQAGIEVQKAKRAQLLAGASAQEIQIARVAYENAQTSLQSTLSAQQNAKQVMVDVVKDAYSKSYDAVLNKADQLFSNPQTASSSFDLFVPDAQLVNTINAERHSMNALFEAWSVQQKNISQENDLLPFVAQAKKNVQILVLFFDHLTLAVNNPNSCLDTSGTCTSVPVSWRSDVSLARSNVNSIRSSITSAESALVSAESAVRAAEGAVQLAKDQLKAKQVPVRSEDLAVFDSQLRQAEISIQEIYAQMAKREIRASMEGIVTDIPASTGGTVSPSQVILSIMSTNPLQVESYIPEKNISFIHVQDEASVLLDAYGANEIFRAKIVSIDPAETLRDGVSTYKTILEFVEPDERIRSGMTASVLIDTEKKTNVLTVPQGIIELLDGKKVVFVQKNGGAEEREIRTGAVSSSGQMEIISGLVEGDVVLLNHKP